MLMTLTPFPRTGGLIGMSLTLFTVLAVASLFVFRRPRPGWQRLRAFNFAWPLIPAAYMWWACMMLYGVFPICLASLSAFATVGAGRAGLPVWHSRQIVIQIP